MERLLNYFVPEKYVLNLDVNKHTKTIGGTVTIIGEVKANSIKLHAVHLENIDVLVNGEKMKFRVGDGVLEIPGLPLGLVEVEIRYRGKLNENMEGAYLSSYEYDGKKELIVATQFESHYAREAFPCIDEPAAKAEFEVNINVPDEDDLVLVNAPSPRMSTYLLAWAIGKFHGKTITNKHGVEITTYCALNQDLDSVDFANEIAARSLEFYDDNFKEPYPLKKLTQVALPDFEAGAMENWGLVTYRESMVLISKDATLGTKKSVALTVAHELSHQWFGDLVTMEWWDDLWLNESFASVMEYYAVDYIHPEYKIFEGFFTGDCQAALNRDAYTGVQSVHQDVHNPAEIATLFDGAIVYAKGARLMLMLIRLMGWDGFCRGIVDYFNKYKYQNTVGDDLWACLMPYADFDVKKFMHAFIDRPGYPVITSVDGNFEEFTQKRFLLDGSMKKSDWPLSKITEDMSGHYVLNLSEKEFDDRLSKFDKLGLEEKLRLLIDKDLVTRAGLQSAAGLVPLLIRFKNESAPSVWNKVAGLVSNLKVYCDDDSEEEKLLKKYVFELIDEKVEEVGLTTCKDDDEDTIRLRANLLALDYFAEDKKRLKKLADMYNDDYGKMDKEIRDDILSAKVYLNPDVVDEFIDKYRTVSDPDVKFDYLSAVCLVRDEKQIGKLIGLLGDVEVVKLQDQLYLFLYLYRNPKARKRTFAWLTSNWDFVKTTGGDKTLSDYPMFVGRLARTEEELKAFVDFFGPMRDDPAVSRAIQIGENEIKARIKLIQKNKASVYEALRSYGAH